MTCCCSSARWSFSLRHSLSRTPLLGLIERHKRHNARHLPQGLLFTLGDAVQIVSLGSISLTYFDCETRLDIALQGSTWPSNKSFLRAPSMATDESHPPDPSTVQRRQDEIVSDATTNLPFEGPGKRTDVEDLEDAKTVIRDGSRRGGSSRAQPAADQLNALNQTPAAITQVLLGKQLNHFLLEELIGGGGMGAVFRAHDEQLDREVAIKVIPFAGEDADLQRRFRNEAQSAAKLDHPRIARVFDVGHQDDWYYIVFEYVKGTNIRDLVHRSDVLSIDDAVYYACQVAEALQHASHRGIVHRDIKPSNVLIDTDREVKLVDMGLARIDKMEMSQDDLTASGVTLGTFDYISPEQAKDPRAADLRSDIYSLGCTLYFMLTGQPPYPGGTMLQKLISHGNAPPPDARHIRANVSHELSAVIQRMLAKKPDDRYQNANDLITDLRLIAYKDGLTRSQGVVAAPANLENPIVLWLERNAPWLAATTLLLLVAAWLQLSSSASRDEFRLVAPSTARIATAVPELNSGLNQAPGSSTDPGLFPAESQVDGTPDETAIATQRDSTGIGLETDTATATLGSMGRASDPPSLPNLPQPDEYPPADGNFAANSLTNGSASAVPITPTNPNSFTTLDASGATVPRLIRLVDASQIIDDQGNIVERGNDGAALTTSLSDALQLAQTFEVDRVELAVSQIDSEPIVIDRDGMSIVSTVGGTTIVFRSPEDDSQTQNQMIALGSNRVEFDDIHFVWDVELGRIQGGSLIGLHSNRLLRLTDCSITIGNAIGAPNIYAFAVTKRMAFDTLGVDEFAAKRSLPLVAIQMYNVIVRGQISLMKMDFDAALQLQWENGLLAVSRRMIETSGATVKPSLTSSPIELSLTRLTSHTQLGLLQMNLSQQAPFPAVINRDVTSCVFVVDEGASHIEVTGLETFDAATDFFKSRGEANAYDVDRVMLSLADQSGIRQQVSMRDLTARRPSWFDERSTRWTIWWKSDLHDDAESGLSQSASLTVVPPDQRTPLDYRQDGAVYSGFDEKSLPQLPFETDNTPLDSPRESGLPSGNR